MAPSRSAAFVLAALAYAALLGLAGCGGDDGDEEEKAATLPTTVDAPGTEDELAFCLGQLVDPKLTSRAWPGPRRTKRSKSTSTAAW